MGPAQAVERSRCLRPPARAVVVCLRPHSRRPGTHVCRFAAEPRHKGGGLYRDVNLARQIFARRTQATHGAELTRFSFSALHPDTSAPASVALQSALRTARRAADIADEASRRADAVARTALINMRIAASSASTLGFGGRAQAQGNGAGPLPKDFLDSLGPVRFAGSLDVVYVPPQLAQTQEDEPSESVSRTPSSKSLGGGSSPSSSPGGSSASSLGRLASSRRKRLSTLGMTALTSSAADGGEASTSRAAAALAGAGSSRSALRSSPRGSGRKRDGKRRHLGVFVYDGGFVVMVKVRLFRLFAYKDAVLRHCVRCCDTRCTNPGIGSRSHPPVLSLRLYPKKLAMVRPASFYGSFLTCV